MITPRVSTLSRQTRETNVCIEVRLDSSGDSEIRTGLGFFDHLLAALACHSRIGITLRCTGDTGVDDHHTIEDCSLALGTAIDRALGERRGIARFGFAYAPLDEALARAVVDLSGRPFSVISLGLVRPSIGEVACENITHALSSMATGLRAAIHLDVLRGVNDHHRAEAAFKSLALALRQAVALTGSNDTPSTKGVL